MLKAFPSITEVEFTQACKDLEVQCDGNLQDCEWTDIRWTGQYLRIRQRRATPTNEHGSRHPAVDESDTIEDNDLEAVCRIHHQDALAGMVDFSIALSPSYQVPVLWFRLSTQTPTDVEAIDRVYSLLVPPATRASLRHVGVLGGISIADHPVSGLPAFFFHPCRTQEVMESLQPTGSMTPVEYLLLWFGVIGAAAGLSIPSAVAARLTHVGEQAVARY